MNTVNLGDKYTHRITLRLNDDQYSFIIKVSTLLGVSPSDYIRMAVNSGMVQCTEALPDVNTEKGKVGTNENVKTDCNNLV